MDAEKVAINVALGTLGLLVTAIGTVRGLIAWADYQAQPKTPKRVPPRHPMKETH